MGRRQGTEMANNRGFYIDGRAQFKAKQSRQFHLMLKFPRLAVLAALLISATAGLAAGPDTLPDGSINFGSASNFSVLTWGDYSQLDNTFTGPSYVKGNVGIGGKG